MPSLPKVPCSSYMVLLFIALFCCLPIDSACGESLFATSFFPPAENDEDPELRGVLKIDLETGAATRFIEQGAGGGLFFPSTIVVGPNDGNLYVGALTGNIHWFDSVTGAPLPSPTGGIDGIFASLGDQTSQIGVSKLAFDEQGTLLAADDSGTISAFNTSTGQRLADVATGLVFPVGMAPAPGGGLAVVVGDAGAPGSVVIVEDGNATTLIPGGDAEDLSGASSIVYSPVPGDYDGDGTVAQSDYGIWQAALGNTGPAEPADGNGDGTVNAADYSVWLNNLGQEGRLIVADFQGNRLLDYAAAGSDRRLLSDVPPPIPDPLPPGVDPANASNFPSDIILTDEGTLLVSTLGLTRRPDNRASVLEFDPDGNLLRTVADGLPALSGIALAPPPTSSAASEVPEPFSILLWSMGFAILVLRSRWS